MQKVLTVTSPADGNGTYIFNEIKEVNDVLKDGYTIVSVTPSRAGQGFYCVFLIVVEKKEPRSGSKAG